MKAREWEINISNGKHGYTKEICEREGTPVMKRKN